MPGGRPEAGETPEETLCREIKEELEVDVDVKSLKHFGSFDDVAAGREEASVHVELYLGSFEGELKPSSEVNRLIWFARNDDWSRLAPVTRNKIIPALIKEGLIHW